MSQLRLHDSYLQVTLKDKGGLPPLPGAGGIFLGEALVPLADVEVTDHDTDLADLPQVQIPLSRPKDAGTLCKSGNTSELIRVSLQSRTS